MKTIIFFISIVFLLGCGDTSKSTAEELKEYSIDLVSISGKEAVFKKNNVPVTGIVVRTFPEYKGEVLKEKLMFKNGQLNGLSKKWWKNGNLSWECNFKEGKKDGTEKSWNAIGGLLWEYNFKSDKKSGIQKEWYTNGQLKSEEYYRDGYKRFKKQLWYESGQLREVRNETDADGNVIDYTQGRGREKRWYENGQLYSVREYIGEPWGRYGLQKEWYPSGKFKYEFFIDEIDESEMDISRYVRGFDESGVEMYFVLDRKLELSYTSTVENALESIEENEVSFLNQLNDSHLDVIRVLDAFKTGTSFKNEWNFFHNVHNHENNLPDSIFYYNGKIKSITKFSHGWGATNERGWYITGELKYEKNYDHRDDKGRVNFKGTYKEWYSNGNLKYDWNFSIGKPNGVCKGYYRNGKICYSSIFNEGELVKKNGEGILGSVHPSSPYFKLDVKPLPSLPQFVLEEDTIE